MLKYDKFCWVCRQEGPPRGFDYAPEYPLMCARLCSSQGRTEGPCETPILSRFCRRCSVIIADPVVPDSAPSVKPPVDFTAYDCNSGSIVAVVLTVSIFDDKKQLSFGVNGEDGNILNERTVTVFSSMFGPENVLDLHNVSNHLELKEKVQTFATKRNAVNGGKVKAFVVSTGGHGRLLKFPLKDPHGRKIIGTYYDVNMVLKGLEKKGSNGERFWLSELFETLSLAFSDSIGPNLPLVAGCSMMFVSISWT